jgi:ABC-type uncharacterized transport system involved in gliding motility auxiliary subunit
VALMKTDLSRYAPLGLGLALLAALASGVLYILQQEWNLYLQISLALIVVGLAFFAVLDPERVRVMLSGRQARYGSNALVLSLAFIGILVVVNYLAYQNPKRWDLTEDATRTLLPETLEALKALPEPVQALAFYPAGINTETALTLLEDYKFFGEGQFDYQFIDPIVDDGRATGEGDFPQRAADDGGGGAPDERGSGRLLPDRARRVFTGRLRGAVLRPIEEHAGEQELPGGDVEPAFDQPDP